MMKLSSDYWLGGNRLRVTEKNSFDWETFFRAIRVFAQWIVSTPARGFSIESQSPCALNSRFVVSHHHQHRPTAPRLTSKRWKLGGKVPSMRDAMDENVSSCYIGEWIGNSVLISGWRLLKNFFETEICILLPSAVSNAELHRINMFPPSTSIPP